MGCIKTSYSSWSTVYSMLRRIRHVAVRKSKLRSEIAIQFLLHCTHNSFSLQSVQKAVGIYQKVYFALTESSSWWEASLRESFPGRLWGPQCLGPCFPLWTHFSIVEGYGSQVSICVSALLCLQFNWQIRTTQGSLLGARHPSLLPPLPSPSVCFWHMSHLKLLWMDMFLGRNRPQTPTALPNSTSFPCWLTLIWLTRSYFLDPFWVCRPCMEYQGNILLEIGSQCHILERELS